VGADSSALYFAICKTGHADFAAPENYKFYLVYTYKITTIFILVSVNDKWNSHNSNFKLKNAKDLVRDR